jgi:hypothetical protein
MKAGATAACLATTVVVNRIVRRPVRGCLNVICRAAAVRMIETRRSVGRVCCGDGVHANWRDVMRHSARELTEHEARREQDQKQYTLNRRGHARSVSPPK